jgi:hypothetical protein
VIFHVARRVPIALVAGIYGPPPSPARTPSRTTSQATHPRSSLSSCLRRKTSLHRPRGRDSPDFVIIDDSTDSTLKQTTELDRLSFALVAKSQTSSPSRTHRETSLHHPRGQGSPDLIGLSHADCRPVHPHVFDGTRLHARLRQWTTATLQRVDLSSPSTTILQQRYPLRVRGGGKDFSAMGPRSSSSTRSSRTTSHFSYSASTHAPPRSFLAR